MDNDLKYLSNYWYNIQADLNDYEPLFFNPVTTKKAQMDELNLIFPKNLIEQETTREKYIEIPEQVLDVYKLYRPTPLKRAYNLEKVLHTPAKIFYKYEGASPTGSHKLNTAIAQAYFNKISGINTLTTETGAGQWGSALAFACKQLKMHCKIFMVKISFEQKPYRRILMNLMDGEVIASPSEKTETGRKILKEMPNSNGSLGIAISEAVEIAAANKDINYALGSVLNHVILHQSVIGLESKKQLASIGIYPDIVIGCCGGGSNFSGISFPFIADKLNGKDVRAIAVEPMACPTLTKGNYTYDYGDTAKLTPIMKMYTLGHNFIPPAIHAGGLRYHGVSPLLSHIYNKGLIEAVALPQSEVYKAGKLFAETEGIIPAPESAHAIATAIKEANICNEKNISKNILFCLSGHGHFDMSFYEKHINRELEDIDYPDQYIKESLKDLPKIETNNY
ncbi:MAG: TrpB-like pyridoxal phosphate-dependent enzyme [Deferribacterota bacterium]|nr:TrpB-like pyridoxal phosphate-dependent enzyme [Deferribacterota bacterium]